MFRSALLAAALVLQVQAEAPRPVTHEALWLMKRVGAPVPSPDGRKVVFPVTQPAYDAKDQTSDLWIRSLEDEAPPRQITFTKGAEGDVAWSPDSRRIAFTAKREGDEVAQVYVLDLAGGGEAQRVTDLALGADAPRWSPDGARLLFVSEVFPGARTEAENKAALKERKDRKYNVRAYDAFPVRHWDHWLGERKAHLFVQEARPGAPALDLLAGSSLAASPGFAGSLQNDGGQTLEAAWTPDGLAVVFAAQVNLDEAARTELHTPLFLVDARGGEPRRLTPGPGHFGHLRFTRDGSRLLCVRTLETPGKAYDLTRLVSFPWPFQDAPRVLTAALDRSVERFALPDSGRVFFTYEEAGLERLHSVALDGGEVRDEPGPANGCITALAAGGTALVGKWESATRPAEVHAFGPGGARPLTAFNAERAAALRWSPVEHFWTASRGRRVHSMVVRPGNFDPARKYPLLVLMHGGAANMWRDAFGLRWNYHLMAEPGYVVLLTDYAGSTGYGEAFARAIGLDPLRGPGQDILAAADDAIARFPFIDGSRQAAAGASYGGHLANWLQATTTRFKAIVSHAGEMDLLMQWGTSDVCWHREVTTGGPAWEGGKAWRDQSPVLQAGNKAKGTGFTTPILITVGEKDFRVPLNNALMNFTLQQRLQVPSRLLVFPDANHWISKGEDSRHWFAEVQGWLGRYLK
ncbi:MAG TPA: S9 family peptidase [Holophaga sp.]|nr:S9 family peptidase [Holophaga sp.]